MPAASDAPTGNASVNRRNATTKPAAFEADERNALTGAGAPSYASGAQKWNGTEAVLNATPPRIITILSPATPARPSSEPIPSATSPSSSDPVAAYTSEIPNRKIAEESAPDEEVLHPRLDAPAVSLEVRDEHVRRQRHDTISRATKTTASEFAAASSAIPVAANTTSE